MRVERYGDLEVFCGDVMGLLVENEVENNVPIGVLNRGLNGRAHEDWFMARVVDAVGAVVLVALMTPPHNLNLVGFEAEPSREALDALIDDLLRESVAIPGTMAKRALVLAFAEAFTARTGRAHRISTDERCYILDAVADVPLRGTLRLAEARDLHFLPYWVQDFSETCFSERPPLSLDAALDALAEKRYYVLDVDGQPVCLAGTSRQMPRGRSVAPVYTPPYFRGHGYATAAVAMLSRLILSWGNEYCVLFTDLANPTSNSIYQKIGYRPVGDYAEIRFE